MLDLEAYLCDLGLSREEAQSELQSYHEDLESFAEQTWNDTVEAMERDFFDKATLTGERHFEKQLSLVVSESKEMIEEAFPLEEKPEKK